MVTWCSELKSCLKSYFVPLTVIISPSSFCVTSTSLRYIRSCSTEFLFPFIHVVVKVNPHINPNNLLLKREFVQIILGKYKYVASYSNKTINGFVEASDYCESN